MAIETTCSGCGKTLSVGVEFAGRQARCPACGQIYTVPSPPVATSTPDLPNPSNPPDVLAGTPANLAETASPVPGDVEQFWMLATDQMQYGPVDRTNLTRWFSEGRVGPGYQIRQGESGPWQPAEYFRPQTNPYASTNPYAATNPYLPSMSGQGGVFLKADQSSLVLVLGIVAWVLCPICGPTFAPIVGLIAWVMGHIGLNDMAAGRMDSNNRGIMQVGYYLGMAQVILSCIGCGGYFVIAAISMIANN